MKVSPLYGVITCLLLSLPGLAVAQPTVDLIWTQSSGVPDNGNGALGTNRVNALPGDQIALDIVVTDGSSCNGIQAAAISLSWDPQALVAYSPEECPSPPNVVPALCNDPFFNFMSPLEPGVTIFAGSARRFDAGIIPPSSAFTCGAPMTLGRIWFSVQENLTEVQASYQQSVDGIVQPNDPVVYYPEATGKVRPPGC